MIRGILFDMDGVIAQTEPLHFVSTKEVMRSLGKELPDSYITEYIGISEKETWYRLKQKYNLFEEIDELSKRKESIFEELVKENLEPTEHFVDFSNKVKKGKMKTALVSSSNKKTVNFIIKKIGFSKYFNTIISEDDVLFKKPDPEPYRLAMKKLGLMTNECVVIEDSPVGIESAIAAGVRCIALTTSFDRHRLKKANLIVDSFSELTIEKIDELLK